MALVFEHPPSLPYPIEHLTIRTALTNRDFYQKELKEFIPDLYSLERNLRKIKAPDADPLGTRGQDYRRVECAGL